MFCSFNVETRQTKLLGTFNIKFTFVVYTLYSFLKENSFLLHSHVGEFYMYFLSLLLQRNNHCYVGNIYFISN